jgi:F-type H+-transporting ATPase subunit b
LKVSGTPLVLFLLLCLSGALSLFATPAYAAIWARQASSPASADASKAQPAADQQDSESDSGDDVYRHSASVKWLGGWMHLGKESSARLFEYLNFAILAGAILFALLKYLPKTFRENREKIQRQLADARKATEEAHERLAAIEQRLGRLDEEIAAISKQAEKDSVEDEARIKASIEAERKRIVDGVTKDIAAAGSAAQRDLKQFAAGLAVDRAAERIALTEADDHALMQEFAQSLGHQGGARKEN